MSNRLSYAELEQIVNTTKPYRGTNNEYPLYMRGQSYKRFLVKKDEQGNTEYHIAYGHRSEEEEVTKEEYATLVRARSGYKTKARGKVIYYKWVRLPEVVGIVRRDNTFEITATSLYQGTRYFLEQMFNKSHGIFLSSIKHGGVIYVEYTGHWQEGRLRTKIIPLFRGQRIDLGTTSSVLNYEVHSPKVNRTKSKAVMAEYADSLKFTEVMFKNITKEVFKQELEDVYKEVFSRNKEQTWLSGAAKEAMLSYARDNLKKDMFKSICAIMMGHNILSSWSLGAGNKYYNTQCKEVYPYFRQAKLKLDNQLKIRGEAFDVKVYKANEVYPSNNWGAKVYLEGNEVSLY